MPVYHEVWTLRLTPRFWNKRTSIAKIKRMRSIWSLLPFAALGCAAAGSDQLHPKTNVPEHAFSQSRRSSGLSRVQKNREPQLVIGATFACGLKSNGRVTCWGTGPSGQLGDGRAHSQPQSPVEVPLEHVRQIAAGARHACALLEQGEVFCWGSNDQGQLALDDLHAGSHSPIRLPLPTLVQTLADNPLCAISEEDDVYCWGTIVPSPLPNGTSVMRVTSFPPVRSLSVTHQGVCAVSYEAEVLCWSGHEVSKISLPGLLTQISIHDNIRCALGTLGQVFCWNKSSWIQDNSFKPTLVQGLTEATRIRVGDELGCALRREGTVACWGDLLRGGPWSWDLEHIAPSGKEATEVPGIAGATDLAVGKDVSCALRRDGQVMCWGSNKDGIIDAQESTRITFAPRIVSGVNLRE